MIQVKPSAADIAETSGHASRFLKAMANSHRLVILCSLTQGECSVSELEAIVGIRQPNLSQQLSRLRDEQLVSARREGKLVYYNIANPRVRRLIGLLYELFCETKANSKGRHTEPPRTDDTS